MLGRLGAIFLVDANIVEFASENAGGNKLKVLASIKTIRDCTMGIMCWSQRNLLTY
jgi:hypothetical protein